MKKIVYIIILYFAYAQSGRAQPPELNGKIRFAWGDEFNGNTINTDMWKVIDNFDNYSDGNGAVAIKRNVSVSGGYLQCKVVQETYSCDTQYVNFYNCRWQSENNNRPYSYTYGRIDSKQKFNQQYGYAEAMMYFPHQPGLWTAFWTFAGDGVNKKNAGEVDIMERIGNTDAKEVTTNIHLDYCPAGTGTDCLNGVGQGCEYVSCYGQKHTLSKEVWYSTKYAMHWNPMEIVFYINDVAVRVSPNYGVDDPLKFILGMGVSTKDVKPTSQFPSILYVDYIRVYDLQECVSTITIPAGQQEVYNHTVDMKLACLKVDGNGSAGGHLLAVATNSIAMLPTFSVKEGGEFQARISSTGSRENTTDDVSNKQYLPLHMGGNSSTITTSEKMTSTESAFTISPNPFTSIAHINYAIAHQSVIKISLYNSMGVLQDELFNENQAAGSYMYELDGLKYEPGIYLLVFESNGLKQKKKVVITK